MPYRHQNLGPVTLLNDPIDPDGTDWVFFSYQDWLRPDETISSHTALIVGGSLVTTSTAIGTLEDADGVTYTQVYGVQVTPTAGASRMLVTHRVSTSTSGSPNLGRTNIDHSVVIPVKPI